jgi:amino acid transporter
MVGGGYKVATTLLGPRFGVVAGSALLVDYVLTIVISVASGAEALFSLLPVSFLQYILHFEVAVVVVLTVLNLRGMKEAIKVLLPIFLGFVFTHLFMIIYGIFRHGSMLPTLVTNAHHEVHFLSASQGLLFTVALFLHAYSIGGGSYTGLEAVSNKVDILAEPRQRTGKWTMFYLACSLGLVAAGILLLYLLWDVKPIAGRTLNAIAFRSILHDWTYSEWMVRITMLFEFGLLFVSTITLHINGPCGETNKVFEMIRE